MSIDAYRAVFESSITFGVRKLNQARYSPSPLPRPWARLQLVPPRCTISMRWLRPPAPLSSTPPSPLLAQAVDVKGDLEALIVGLEAEIEQLKAEVASLTALCISLEYREEQQAKTYEVRSKELVDLSSEKEQLEKLLATLKASKPDKPDDGKK